MRVDPNGTFFEWISETFEKASTWIKENSFLYNVVGKSITAYAGAGVGIGVPSKVIDTQTSAQMGFGVVDGEFKFGEFGENSVFLNIGNFSIGWSRTGFTNDHGKAEPWEQGFDIKYNFLPKKSFSYVASGSAEFSISFKSIYQNFMGYGKKHWGW